MGKDNRAAQSQPLAAQTSLATSGIEPSAITCATCKYMGRIYHDGGLEPNHSCEKSDQRRGDAFRPTGDRAEDFMRAWRTFYDATPAQRACAYYSPGEPISAAWLGVLAQFSKSKYTASRFATFRFLSDECTACERMDRMYVMRERDPDTQHKSWRLTPMGLFALQNAAQPEVAGEATHPGHLRDEPNPHPGDRE